MAKTVFKPAGVPVFPPHADPQGACVLATLLADEPWRSDVEWPEGFAGGIAHRLDVKTSGALLVADDAEETLDIREAFATRRFLKTYRFIAARDVQWSTHKCELPIAHDRRRRSRMIVQRGKATPHRGQWHDAETRFKRLGPRLWEATIRTGVMHQIRVHAAFVGLPLVGDSQYGGGPGTFSLHHMGMFGAGRRTEPVPLPHWARTQRELRSTTTGA
ncbi:MAG: 23S rRNA pseudouridine1911/1915/1917 synthase [Myxococcota bacterium]|jgi:23S rRNA pseudouridine1911/1915/1917 synthase